MKTSRNIACAAGLLVAVLGVACKGDPQAQRARHFERANEYAAEKNFDAAIIEYRNAIQQDPQFGEAYFRLSAAYLQIADAQNALRSAVRAADLMPENTSAQLQAGNLLVLAGRFEDAKARAQQVLSRDKASVAGHVLLGHAMAGMKDLDTAVKQIEEALTIDPARTALYSGLGTLHAARGDRDAAEKAFKDALQRDPKSLEARFALAQFYWSSRRLQEAEELLESAVALAPKEAAPNRALAVFYQMTGRSAEAETFLKQAVEADPAPASRMSLADYYASTNRSADAVPILTSLQSDPRLGTTATVRLAAIEQSEGRLEPAMRIIDGVLAKDKANAAALVVKAAVLLSDRKVDEALAQADAALAADRNSAPAHYVRGRVLVAARRLDDAKQAFNEVLRLNPQAAAAQVELARLHLAAGATDTSVAFAGQAARNEPRSIDARLILARGLMARHDLLQAEGVLRELRQAAPDRAAVHAQMGFLLAMKGDRSGATEAFNQALEIEPLQLDALGGLVALDLAAKRVPAALDRVQAAVSQAPDNPGVLVLAGRVHMSTGDAPGAEKFLLRAVERDSSSLPAYALLGQLYIVQRRLDDARLQFERLAEREQKPVPALTMIGMIHQMQDRTEDARKVFERTVELDSRAAVAANNLAWIYAEEGQNLDRALHLAQTAKAALPDQPEVDDTLGWVYYKKGLLPLAIAAFKRSTDHDPRGAVYHYHLGLAYAKSGDKVRARRSLEAALKLQKTFPGASEAERLLASL
jgi:tetratricopeptide (TPR) repeat protein